MEKGNGLKRWIWITGIVILVLVGIAGFLTKATYQDLKAKNYDLEKTDKELMNTDKELTSDVNGLKMNYLILDAKMNLLLRQAGYSQGQIKELEDSYKYKRGGDNK